jgi:hypothetical protein
MCNFKIMSNTFNLIHQKTKKALTDNLSRLFFITVNKILVFN